MSKPSLKAVIPLITLLATKETRRLPELLIDAGANLHQKGKLGRTPPHIAAVVDFESGAALLLRSGANGEAGDDGTWTPLHLACGCGGPRTQKVLMSNGADVNHQDEDGWTALHQAAYRGNIENAQILLAAGAKIDVGTIPTGFTPLHTAITYEKKAMLLFLLESGADHLRRTSAGLTLLQLAVLADGHSILQEFLEWSTDSIDEQSIDKSSAIHIAAGRGLAITVNILRAYGADINLGDVNGLKPRDVAAKFGHVSIAMNLDVTEPNIVKYPPDTIFSNSRYRSRAWTLQENILSPRCLYITNNQVFYSCHGQLRTEDHRQTTRNENKASKSVNWFRDAVAEAQLPQSPSMFEHKWMQLFVTYSRLVRECTSGNLSNPADVRNAVLGPMMTLSPYLGQFSLAGLPDTHIDYALLWPPSEKGVKSRNEHFPSWSWAGWNCSSTYYGAPVYLGSDWRSYSASTCD